MTSAKSEVQVSRENHVGIVEICRPPHNFFDPELIRQLADAFEALDADPSCRSLVLCAPGSSFYAGAHLGVAKSSRLADSPRRGNPI